MPSICFGQQSSFCLIVLLTVGLVPINSSYVNGTDIIVGVVTTGDITQKILQEKWVPTFKVFLTGSVGKNLNPPRNFSVVLLDIPTAFQMVNQKAIDFLFSTPSFFSCVESENSGHRIFFLCFMGKGHLTHNFQRRQLSPSATRWGMQKLAHLAASSSLEQTMMRSRPSTT